MRYFEEFHAKNSKITLSIDNRVKRLDDCEYYASKISVASNVNNLKSFKFNILHFNDVYQLESTRKEEPVGGIIITVYIYLDLGFARFHSVIENYRSSYPKESTLLLFSGDCFSPSTHSIITKGKHMIQPLNCLNIDAACLGNHDLDFGFDVATVLLSQTNFPWVLSNVVNSKNSLPLVGTHLYTIINREDVRIGIIGLAEKY